MPVLWEGCLESGLSFQVELPQKEQTDLAWAWWFAELCIDGRDQKGAGPFLSLATLRSNLVNSWFCFGERDMYGLSWSRQNRI